jgi:hypothetical protein
MATNILMRGTQANYNSLGTKNANTLYFTTDTHALYVGSDLYTEPVRFVTSRPANPATGVLYLNTTTGLGETHNGSSWTTVIRAVVTTINGSADDATTPTTKAVKDYVDDRVEEILGGDDLVVDIKQALNGEDEPIPGTIEVSYGDESTATVALEGVAHNPTYDSGSLVLTIPVVGDSALVINLPQDNFVSSGAYNTETKNIELTLADTTVVYIPASDLVDIYTSGSGTNDTVSIAVGSDNKITATIKVDTASALSIDGTGKLTIDLSSYLQADDLDELDGRVDDLETATTWGTF